MGLFRRRSAPANVKVVFNGQPMDVSAMTHDGAVDWNEVMSAAMHSKGLDSLPPHITTAEILERGSPAQATLLGTFPPPVPMAKPGKTWVGLILEVRPEGKAPNEVRIAFPVPDSKVGLLVPGAQLPVKIDPRNVNLVAVDWDSVNL